MLHIFHLCRRSFLWILVYKILNAKGKIYLKLDADFRIKKINFNKLRIKNLIIKWIFNKCQLISIETTQIYNFLKENWKLDVKHIPNGFYFNKERNEIIKYEQKENIICTVGRIGTKQKATEILLQGFKLASNDIRSWKLKIIGPIEEQFQKYIDKFFQDNPKLKNRIIFTGSIYDRNLLNKEYEQAKIFCLTSRWEGFPLVLVEAIKNGCYIICSEIDSALDITKKEQYGKIFPIDDSNALARYFVNVCNNEKLMKSTCQKIQDYAYEKFYWPNICKDIDNYLKSTLKY